MKYGMYCIYDKIANDSGFPFDAKNDGVALRKFQSFLAGLTKENENLSTDEFELRYVGDYDSELCSMNGATFRKVDPLEVE